MPGKILGLDISDDSITAVRVASGLKGYQITACARVMIEGDDGPDDALKGLFDQTDLNSDICFASIPGEHVSYRNLQIPFKDPKKIRQTLPFEIETMVPFRIEDLVVDFSIIDRSDQSDILAVSMKKAFISEYLERLQPHGIDPDVLDIRCVPLVSRLLKREGTPDDGLFLQIDGKRNTMVLYLKRRVVLVRTFAFDGASVAWSASDAVNDDTGAKISKQGESYLQSFCTMVQNTIHAFASQNNRVIRLQKVFFTGSGAIWPRTKELLNRFLGIPAEQVDLSRDAKVNIDENIARIWNPALMDNALALALRDTKRGQGFNFRKGEFEKKKHYFGQKKELRKAAIIFMVVLSFLAADIGVDYYFLKKKHETLAQKITEVFKQTFPDVKRIPPGQEVNMMKGKINVIKESAISHPAIGGNDTVLELLKDISKRIPESLDIRVTRMVVDLKAVRISGNTDTFNTVDKIKNDLESSDCFSAATISSAKLDRTGNRVEFEIKLERAV